MISVKYLSKRFDEGIILATLAKLAFKPEDDLSEQDYMVLAALKRSSESWDLSTEQIAERLASYDEQQIIGLVNNVKGILHEMVFQQLENENGDSIIASLYPDTNHRAVDIQMLDLSTGDTWDIQLKATDQMHKINQWMEQNPDTQILVTEELAQRMDLPSSGISNQELSVRVEDFVEQMVSMHHQEDDSIWENFPILVAASSGIIIFEAWRQYRQKKITLDSFKWLTIKTLGLKASKYAAIFSALAVPGLNILVGAYLLGSFIFSVQKIAGHTPDFKPFSFLAKQNISNQ